MSKPKPAPVALITGAANRIGAVIARRLAHDGYAVIIHHRNSGEDAAALVEELRSAGANAASIQADLLDREQRAGLIAHAEYAFGPATVLVNNASIYEADSVEDLDEELWNRHFGIHCEAPIFLARDFAARLPAGLSGNIINMIDERVLQTTPARFSYTLSKATLWTGTRMLAQSLAPRIRVNAIGPGPTLKGSGESDHVFASKVNELPLQHGPTPDEIASAVAFILSIPSMTGQLLALDGGEHLSFTSRYAKTPRT